MANTETPNGGCIIPTIIYDDAPAAVEWLCDKLGFEKTLIVPHEDGGIAHAQLKFGNSMVMLSSAGSPNLAEYTDTLRRRKSSMSVYVVDSGVDEHYKKAKAAGAEIVLDLEEQDYGGKLYSCRDPEGHLWHFGSYDPWAPAQ